MTYDPWNAKGPEKAADNVVPMPGQRHVPEKARKAAAARAGKPLDQAPDEPPMFSDDETGAKAASTVAAGQLRALIERIERLEEEKQTMSGDIKEVYAEAKGNGFDTKAIRTIVRLRKKDQAEREEEEAIIDLYKAALGMA